MILATTPLLHSRAGVTALGGALLLTLLGACAPRGGSPGRGRGAAGATPVLVGQAERKVVPVVLDSIGTVEPIRTTAVRAQITGTLLKICIREGQEVKAGDLLFEIDPRPFQQALRSAVADQERIAAQRDTARAQLARYQELNIGTEISHDQFQQIKDTARALQAQAVAAEAAVATAELQLGYCSIRAPISGRTGYLNVHEGDLVRTSDAGVLVTVNQLSPIYVTFGIPQQQLAAVNRHQQAGTLRVEAIPPADDAHPVQGELTFVDNTVDPATGTIRLKGTFPNAARELWPGQFTTVTMTLAAPEVLTVPASAVQNDQAGQHVFVVKPDRTAEFRRVTVERTFEDAAVVTRGLVAGEVVVTDGQLRVTPGAPVQIKPPESRPGSGGTSAASMRPLSSGRQ